MAEKLFLDRSIATEHFVALLHGGLALGGYLQSHIADGHFYVWVPEGVTSVDLSRVRQNIFYPEPFDVDPARRQAIEEFLRSEHKGIAIADSCYDPPARKPEWFQHIEWFSLKSPPDSGPERLCGYVRSGRFDAESYEALIGASSAYTTTLTLTTLADPSVLGSGMDMDNHPDVLEELLDRIQQVMVGAFDEMTMIVWTRVSEGKQG